MKSRRSVRPTCTMRRFWWILGLLALGAILLSACAPSAPPPEPTPTPPPEPGDCVDFSNLNAGEVAPSFEINGFVFSALDGGPQLIYQTYTPAGLGLRIAADGVEVSLRGPTSRVVLRIVSYHSDPLQITAFNSDGDVVTQVTAPAYPRETIHTVEVTGQAITSVVIEGGEGEGVLVEICIETEPGAPTGAPCVDFEDPPLGTKYNVLDMFTDSGATIFVGPFQWDNGQWTSDGNAEVGDAGLAGGEGQEILVNDVNLVFDFRGIIEGLSLCFGEYGGNLNIKINDEFVNFENFSEIDGQNIGGVDVLVVNGFGNDTGSLELAGVINSFAVGGQELFIDDVCPSL